jgi:hypothetical protein
LVWWKRHKKAESTWEDKTNLLEVGLEDEIFQYEEEAKAKAKPKQTQNTTPKK